MPYFNYHAKIKNLIISKHLVDAVFVVRWNNIAHCIVLFFDNHSPMPIRPHAFKKYQQNSLIAKAIDCYKNFILQKQ